MPTLSSTHSSRRKWFARAPGVPPHWFPRDDLGVQFGGRFDDSAPREVGADTWFDRKRAARFMVRDQVVRYLTELPAGSDDLSAL